MKIKQTVIALAVMIGISGFLVAPTASAAIYTCGTGVSKVTLKPGQSCCGGVVTSLVACDQPGGQSDKIENSGVWGLLLMIINIFSAGVGIAAVGGVVYGSILYTTASGSLDQVKKARTVIANTVVGIVLYIVLYAFLNYLIPGGLFN